MKKLLIVFSSAVLLLLSGTAFSQDDLFVHGIIKDTETLKKLDGIIVTVFQNGSQWDSYTTSANAKYEFNLESIWFKYFLISHEIQFWELPLIPILNLS